MLQLMDVAGNDAMHALGKKIGGHLAVSQKIALHGSLGAGKTTLARGILHGAGYDGEVPSPTFSIVQGYEPPETVLPIYHTDLYRIESPVELQEIGIDDMLYDGVLIAEWPDRMPDHFWNDALHISIEIINDDCRRLTVQPGGAWKDIWASI